MYTVAEELEGERVKGEKTCRERQNINRKDNIEKDTFINKQNDNFKKIKKIKT